MTPVAIPCPACGRKTKKSIRWIKTHTQLACACGVVTRLEASQFRRQIAAAERALARFQSALKQLNKRR